MIERNESPEAWKHCLAVVRPAPLLAPSAYLAEVQSRLAAAGIQAAIARHDTAALYDWIVRTIESSARYREQQRQRDQYQCDHSVLRLPDCR